MAAPSLLLNPVKGVNTFVMWSKGRGLLTIAVALIALEAGYFMGKDAVKRTELRQTFNANTPSPYRQSQPKQVISLSNSAASITFSQRDLVDKLNATPTDVEQTRSLQKRKAAGEFILRNEPPLMRKSQEWSFQCIASEGLTNNAPDYDRQFSKLCIDGKTGQELQIHLARIHRASLEAESATLQLLDAQAQYDQRIRRLLVESNYLEYREYEELKAAKLEVLEFQRTLQEAGVAPLNASCELDLARLLHNSQAEDEMLWHGPYSSPPRPTIGFAAITSAAEEQTRRISVGIDRTLTKIGEIGLSPAQQAALFSFLQGKLDRKHLGIEMLKVSPIHLRESRETPSRNGVVRQAG